MYFILRRMAALLFAPHAIVRSTATRLPAYIPELDGIRAIAADGRDDARSQARRPVFGGIADRCTPSAGDRERTRMAGCGSVLLALRIFPLYFLCVAAMACFYHGNGAYFLLSTVFLANMVGLLGVAIPQLLRATRKLRIAEPILRAVFVAKGTDGYNPFWSRFDGLASCALLAIWFRSPWASQPRTLMLAGSSLAAALSITMAGLSSHIMRKTVAGISLRYNLATLVHCAGSVHTIGNVARTFACATSGSLAIGRAESRAGRWRSFEPSTS
jgi:hypothetical protein